jgi:hypothetical protein
MIKSDQIIRCGDFKTLRQVIARTGFDGHWTEGTNHCQFLAASGAILNYWKSTGTINLQGPEFAAAELQTMVLHQAHAA